MATYNSIINRSDSSALVPEQVSTAILQGVGAQSAAMRLLRRLPNMSTNQTRMPVLAGLPTAYFVNGDTGLKQTTDVSWANKYLNAEEIAAIIPIPEAVLDDASYDIWGQVKPELEGALARTLDAAVFFGTNAPSSWPTNIAAGATAVSSAVTRGTAAASAGGIATDISNVIAKLESDGFMPTGAVGNPLFRQYLRNAVDTTGQPHQKIQMGSGQNPTDNVHGVDIVYGMKGQWSSGTGAAEVIMGDFTQAVISLRQDVTYKILDQAVIQDGSGNIIYNLAQQDMVALRVVMRVAWQIANIINYQEQTEANRYPFARLNAA